MARPTKAAKETPIALIEAAERIFAEQGVDTASLRAIAVAAGSANSFAVQYHFGGREALVTAIFDHRLNDFERRRAALLREAGASGAPTIRGLLATIVLPLFEQTDEAGRHSYAAFLSSLRQSSSGFARRTAASDKAPILAFTVDRLRDALPHLDAIEFGRRTTLAFGLMLDAIQQADRGTPGFETQQAVIAQTLALMESLFRAPTVG